jgi:hypothetical protein
MYVLRIRSVDANDCVAPVATLAKTIFVPLPRVGIPVGVSDPTKDHLGALPVVTHDLINSDHVAPSQVTINLKKLLIENGGIVKDDDS